MNDHFLRRPASNIRPETDVETRLLYAAYERKPMNVLMTVGATFFITALLWRLFPSSALTLWAAAILSVAALGYLECKAFQRAAPQSHSIARWKTLFLAQSTLAGATWASGPSLMIQGASGTELTLFVAILLAVCSVATTSMAEQRTSMMAFVSAVTVPPAFMLWNRGG